MSFNTNIELSGKVIALQTVHSDPRRVIHAASHADFLIQRIHVGVSRSVLGNHFHKGKREVFLIVKGAGRVFTQMVNENGITCEEVIVQDVGEGDVIVINPFVAHTFILDPYSDLVSFSSSPFDEKNMDMTEIILVDPKFPLF